MEYICTNVFFKKFKLHSPFKGLIQFLYFLKNTNCTQRKLTTYTGVSISTDDRRPTTDETRGLHCSEKSATFSSEEEATSLNNAMDKNIICSRGNVRNLV